MKMNSNKRILLASLLAACTLVPGLPAQAQGGNVSAVHPLLNKANGVDASKELTPIAAVATPPFFVFARATIPVNTLAQLADWAATPGPVARCAHRA